ncbi:hypothetical protein BDK51DRAFT_41748 [Blyttiomyces helicus]|uniref:Uncharacterized protein n=1 Tax=Blyttiomyces helicus TaxID=388810 RepID=A0A4P9WD86_9FUNG|nr:hypothetical protein BDK51DRAFT_41748 [Blyttiomyces helicus]|eukprot:RKO90494.1 hypothetical protein BDK51DRAFT_41748 [Blyttiomyces helicus]
MQQQDEPKQPVTNPLHIRTTRFSAHRSIKPLHRANLRHLLRSLLLSVATPTPRSSSSTAPPANVESIQCTATLLLAQHPVQNRFPLLWKLGVEILRRIDAAAGGDAHSLAGSEFGEINEGEVSEDGKRLLRFLVKMSSMKAKPNAQLLLEMTLYHMRYGMIEEAYDRLEGYDPLTTLPCTLPLSNSWLTLFPYSENSVLLGYAGILSYNMWRSDTIRTRDDADPDWRTERQRVGFWGHEDGTGFGEFEPIDDDADCNSRHYINARQHFEQSFNYEFQHDMFLFYYVKVAVRLRAFAKRSATAWASFKSIGITILFSQMLLASGDIEVACAKVREFIELNPTNPNGHRYLTQLIRGTPEWVGAATHLLARDPLSRRELALVPLVEQFERLAEAATDPDASLSILALFANRLDHEPGDAWMWGCLVKHLREARLFDPTADEELWTERRKWWPRMHFLSVPLSGNGSRVDAETATAKYLAAHYLFPTQYPTLAWPARTRTARPLPQAQEALIFSHGLEPAAFWGTPPSVTDSDSEEETWSVTGSGERDAKSEIGDGVRTRRLQPARGEDDESEDESLGGTDIARRKSQSGSWKRARLEPVSDEKLALEQPDAAGHASRKRARSEDESDDSPSEPRKRVIKKVKREGDTEGGSGARSAM